MIQNMLFTGKKALQVNEAHLETIAHNINNVNTLGYSRQRVIQESTYPLYNNVATIGTGVKINEIRRERDFNLDNQYRKENKNSGYWQTMSGRLKQIEEIFNEPSDIGLTAKLNTFWDSWDSLANNPNGPNGMVNRQTLVSNTKSLADEFNRLDSELQFHRESINKDIENTAKEINSIFKELATLNKQIHEAKINKNNPNDLLDKFDLLMDELSQYGDTRLVINSEGKRSVFFGTDEVVDFDFHREIITLPEHEEKRDFNKLKVVYKDNHMEFSTLNSGKLNALYNLRDELIPKYQNKIDDLAVSIAKNINDIHRSGYDIQNPPSDNHHFFEENITGAKDFDISYDIANNLEFIAASLEGEPGDNRIALKIAELRHKAAGEEKESFNDIFANTMFNLGIDSNIASKSNNTYKETIKQVNNFRESVKGVSINDEAALLIQYQQSYHAAAKIIKAADEALSAVINMI